MVDQQCNTFLRQRTIQLSTDAIYDRPNRAFFSATVGQINDRYLAGGQQGVHFFFTGFTTLEHVVCTWIYDPPAMDKILGDFFYLFSSDVQKKETFFLYIFVSLLEFTLTRVLFFFVSCVFRVFFLVSLLSLCEYVGVVDVLLLLLVSLSLLLPGSWIVFSTLVLQPSNPRRVERKERERGSHANRITHVNG